MSDGTDEVAGIAADASKRVRRRRRVGVGAPAETPETPDTDLSTAPDDGGDDGGEGGPAATMEDLEVRDMLPKQPLKPAENVKSLGDMCAKYGIGSDPEFKLQVWRTWPKIFPGGAKADGFYDTWDQPLTEELIQSEYGGGNFRIVVMGPHPSKPNTLKHFDSISLNLGGNPKYERQPKAIQNQTQAAPDAALPPPMMMGGENAKLSETAMKLAVDMASKEREERVRVEERAEKKAEAAAGALQPAVEAERRRADDLIRAERDRSEMERRLMQERFEEARSEAKKLLERIEQMEANRPSVATELAQILPFTQQKQGDGESGGGKVAERMMESVLEKHRVEMEAMRASHQQMIDNLTKQHEATLQTMRTSHLHEITTMREGHARDLQAERESALRRQERADDQLRMEREERRRDQEQQRERLEAVERSWKERIEAQLQSTNQSWESRHQSVISTYENRALWLQQEIDRLKSETSEMRGRMTDNSDPIAIVTKAKEIREAIGGPDSGGGGGSGGGIGMGGGEDWKNLAVEGLTERAPQLLQALGNLLSGQQQQPQYQVGQVVPTPQGEMVVVQTPGGGLGFTPKAALDAAMAQQQGRMLPQQGSGGGRPQRRHVMPDAEEVANGMAARKKKRGPISAVPNFADPSPYGADPLPVRGRRPPWEGGGQDDDEPIVTPNPQAVPQLSSQQQRPQQGAQQQPARRTSKPEQAAQPQQRIARQMTAQERQGINVLAKLIHDAVMNADDPEDFADKMLKEWAPETLKRVTAAYGPEDIARGIAELHPTSAGATPAGRQFVLDAFKLIEDNLP